MLTSIPNDWYDADCRRCKRLESFLRDVKNQYPDYHCGPVAPFGPVNARLLIVGLAPGKHGANASGRPFTGDYAGILLYQTLHKYGFANKPDSVHRNDGLKLKNCRITNAVKCLPPDNKPENQEVINCNSYLVSELKALPKNSVIITLGGIAHKAVLRTLGLKQSAYPFSHGARFKLDSGHELIASYHCSRYNTQTNRLTTTMFEQIFTLATTLMRVK